ncbi:MAG: SET domain-containing protein [Chitinophagaceae bacterium]|nr:MAG: SET domain-containing protein [Chitinophagaceae bacterium]
MALLEKHLFVDDSTIPGAGKGLFTKTDIEKGTRIVEYKGRRTTWKEVKNDSDNYYIYTINRNNVIDAQKTLSALARYANDARGFVKVKGLNNNCVYVNEGTRAFIEAVKDIPAGAEIFVDYTQDYWKVLKENLRNEKQREKEEAKKQLLAQKKKSPAKKLAKKATGKKTTTKKTAASKKKGASKKSTSK